MRWVEKLSQVRGVSRSVLFLEGDLATSFGVVHGVGREGGSAVIRANYRWSYRGVMMTRDPCVLSVVVRSGSRLEFRAGRLLTLS